MQRKLILASASPRRRQFLKDLGISFDVLVSGAPERHEPGETPEAYVARNAREKAVAAANLCSPLDRHAVILGADTIVVSPEGAILEKPADADDAARMLRLLSGRRHRVLSSFALVDAANRSCLHSHVVVTQVSFRRLEETEIRGYVASGEPLDKAGAYGIQGRAAAFVDGVEGSYTSVVGLPLCEVIAALKEHMGLKLFAAG